MSETDPARDTFRPQARLLLLLGEQLIREPSLAVFELVKNAYDADASECTVSLHNPDDVNDACIFVKDNGMGMTSDILRKTWLVIGTDYRARQRADGYRTPRFRRLPLGEKGIGRLAVHKLGRRIKLTTRVPGGEETVLAVNWDMFDAATDLAQVRVRIRTQEATVFPGKKHGTLVEVSHLRESWTRAKVRALHRSVVSLCSPYAAPSDFHVTLNVEPTTDWLEGLLDVSSVLEDALYHARGSFEGRRMVLDYDFRPFAEMRHVLKSRKEHGLEHQLVVKVEKEVTPLDLSPFAVGRVAFEFHVYDREPGVLDLTGSGKAGLKKYLNENGGIRIYRDGVRVFDFGEPGNDWLNLDVRRVNKPVVRVSNNQILGALMLDGAASTGLVEKTNREGFIENDAYDALRKAVVFALTQFEAERQKDQKNVRLHYSRQGPQKPVVDEIQDLRDSLQRRGLLDEFGQHLNRIEKQFQELQDIMLTAAAPGLTFASVIHQAEKVLKELVKAVDANAEWSRIRSLVKQLAQMMDGLTFLVRKSGQSKEKASTLMAQAIFNNELRFQAHHIRVTNGLANGNPDFIVKCVRRLIVATLVNLIDNSIYWLESTGQKDRQIYLGTSLDLDDLPSLVVADNGPGFRDEPDSLMQPFFSRKPDGMGLGLYIANEVAKQHQGRLLFPQQGDLELPPQFTGAVVALQFPGKP